ncbi:MAG TPA: hypothetical protein VHX60_15690 [Acidobacteriaceae bacterium]|jgi:hypothetical protein|nr:hypothetical protein [Acidobacteriaceae bacterium]
MHRTHALRAQLRKIAKDPSFARAYLATGNAELNLVSLTREQAEEAIPKVRAAAQKAIDLDPSLAEAWGCWRWSPTATTGTGIRQRNSFAGRWI